MELVELKEAGSRNNTEFAQVMVEYDDYADSHLDILKHLTEELKRRGLYRPGLIFTGMEGGQVKDRGFGDRESTFGLLEEDAMREAEADSITNPVDYALREAESLPAIAVFDSEDFAPTDTLNNQWGLKPGRSMDQAAVIVCYFKD